MENDNYVTKIKSKYFDLRPSEVKVANFVLRNPKKASKISISNLSEITGVSQPTIVRFVKSIGYSGYREFKDEIIEDIVKNKEIINKNHLYGFNLKKEEEIREIPGKVINTTISILETTLQSMNIEAFEKAIELITASNKIGIYGVENSRSVISDLANKLLYLGLDVRCHSDVYMQNLCANSLTEDDLAIVISYSGTSKDTIDIIKRAKNNNAKTLVITNFGMSMISEYADVVLNSSNSKLDIYGSAIFSRSSQIVVVDMLYMGIILSDYDKFSKVLDYNGEVSSYKSY
ncbi:MAG: MurR/RpiR family transcriptional regulator [Peptostreptococcaceae bacterium]